MKKSLFCIMLAAILCFAAAPAVLAVSVNSAQEVIATSGIPRTVLPPSLTLHAEPDPASAVVATVYRGEYVYGNGMDWTDDYITITTESGVTGWANIHCMILEYQHLVICEDMPLYASPKKAHITDILPAGTKVDLLEDYTSSSGEEFYVVHPGDSRTGYIPKFANVYNAEWLESYLTGRFDTLTAKRDTSIYTQPDRNAHIIAHVRADDTLQADSGPVSFKESGYVIVLIDGRYGYIPKEDVSKKK